MDELNGGTELKKLKETAGLSQAATAINLPSKLSNEDIRQMADGQIVALLSEERKLFGTLHLQNLHLLTHEANRRAMANEEVWSWTTKASVWTSVIVAVGALLVIAIIWVWAFHS